MAKDSYDKEPYEEKVKPRRPADDDDNDDPGGGPGGGDEDASWGTGAG